MKFRKLKIYKPYLEASLNIGFMGFATYLFTERIDMFSYTYIGCRWYFFKWNGRFALYKPGEEIR